MRQNKAFYRRGMFLLTALLVLFSASSLGSPTVALAHPLGNFTINRYTRIEVGAGQIYLTYVLDMAEIPTFQEMARIDLNNDGTIDDNEHSAYLPAKADELIDKLYLAINGVQIPMAVEKQTLVFPPGLAGAPTLRISLQLLGSVQQAGIQGSQDLYYLDSNYAQRIGWKEIVVMPGYGVSLLESTAPTHDKSDELRNYPRDFLSNPPDQREALSKFVIRGGAGEETRLQSPSINTVVETRDGSDDLLTSLITADKLSLPVVALAFILALGLGAAHAITPGHGKSIMAAYLVGTRGTAKHALFLGFTVTVSHTLGVLGLGLVVLFASNLVATERLYPWLGLISGVTIIVVGLWLLMGRLRNGQETSHRHPHAAADSQSPSNSQFHPVATKPARFHRRLKETVANTLHGHSHHADHHSHNADSLRITWKSLTALGIVGGLVPSVAALVILLAAISLHRIGFGLALILAFSVGMATVLAGLGLLLIYARKLVENFKVRNRFVGSFTRFLPLATALIVLLSGLVVTVRAAFQIGVL